ncbi:sugar ABC transporter substrate-binding protein [Sorangium sp. So ce233]|uniref:sugar ABC transporter substrate-binding protein n=1 Tax=Sorangium sp. So ce233 TaxID=3133290 RepID=UPI003F6351DF
MLQNLQIQQAVTDGAAGIGLAPISDIQTAAVDEAVAKGAHVVTLDSDVAASKRSIYVGTLDRSAGATAGNTLLAMLPPPPGTVVIHGSVNAAGSSGLERTQGARDVFEAAGYEVLVRQSTWAPSGETDDVEEMRDPIETADPPVVGLSSGDAARGGPRATWRGGRPLAARAARRAPGNRCRDPMSTG